MQAPGGVFKHRLRLVSSDTREPIEKLFQPGTGFEVLEPTQIGATLTCAPRLPVKDCASVQFF